jgi:hypothetical protein
MIPHLTCHLESRQAKYSRVELPEDPTMVFVIPMFLALLMAVAAMIALGVFALRESDMMAVFHEDTDAARSSRTTR